MINANLFRKELKRHRNSAVAWTISICGLILLGMAFFPIIMKEDIFKQMSAFFETPFMKSMMAAFGADLEIMTNVLGFYCMRSASFIMLLGSFFSIMLASRILSEEERDNTAEFLLTKPVTRIEVLGSKLAVFFTYLVMLNLVTILTGFISLEIFKGKSDYRILSFLTHSFYSFLLMLTFGAIGLFISLLIKRGRPITNISIGIVVGGYFFDVLSKITRSADMIGYISPFKFIDSNVLLPDYSLTWWRLLYFLGVSFTLFAITFFYYKKKDILL